MEQNPFSLYDFMGYLFPGCLVLIIFSYFYELNYDLCQIVNISNIDKLISVCNGLSTPSCLVIIVVGYTIGHIVAYLSSVFVETIYTIRVFGYPSSYLLGKIKKFSYKKDYFEIDKLSSNNPCSRQIKILIKALIRLLVLFILLPVSFGLFVGRIFDLNPFIVRPLDTYLQNTLKEKQYRLAEKLKISHPDVNVECDYHRILMHYVYINIPRSQAKTNNYLALYGFLRSLTLIVCVTFDIIFVMALCSINFSTSIDFSIIFYCVLLFTIAFFLYLAFLKFYRRFTLENMMCMLVGTPDDENHGMSHVYQS